MRFTFFLFLKLKYFLWKFGFDFHKLRGFDHIHALIKINYHKDFTFLQIGANDGKSYDPIFNFVKFYKLNGYCLEPIDSYFNKLVYNYRNHKNVVPIKLAIYEKSGKIILYKHIEDVSAPEWTVGMSSVKWEHHLNNGVMSSKMEEVTVDALTFEDFFKLYPIKNIDFLQVDVEGYDYNIIKMFPFDKYKPKIIQFEHGMPNNFMTRSQVSEIICYLMDLDYKIITKEFDLIAFLD